MLWKHLLATGLLNLLVLVGGLLYVLDHGVGVLSGYVLAALLCSAGFTTLAAASAGGRSLRREVSLSFVLDGTVAVAGYQVLVETGTYDARPLGYVGAILVGLVLVGMGAETARGNLLPDSLGDSDLAA